MFNPSIFANLPPMVYRVKKNEETEMYYLEQDISRFDLPKKIYGRLEKYRDHFWNYYNITDHSVGVLLTGDAGTGKTELAKLISNKAIESGIPVILISDLDGNLKLIEFLNTITYAVIIFDEFAKMFPSYLQEKMLTFLSDVSYTKKLFILTENNKNTISEFIRNRPGRIRYHLHFTKLDWETVEEFCKDNRVSEEFLKELKNIYSNTIIFSFDHLNALVKEHKLFPELTFKEILEILNLELFNKPIYIEVYSVKKKDQDDELIAERTSRLKEEFRSGYNLEVKYKEAEDSYYKSIYVSKDDVVYNNEKDYIFEKNGFVIKAKETTELSVNTNKDTGKIGRPGLLI